MSVLIVLSRFLVWTASCRVQHSHFFAVRIRHTVIFLAYIDLQPSEAVSPQLLERVRESALGLSVRFFVSIRTSSPYFISSVLLDVHSIVASIPLMLLRLPHFSGWESFLREDECEVSAFIWLISALTSR